MVGRVGTAGTAAASQDIDEAIFKQGVVMQMTLPGAPTLYYGDEAGVCGWTDPDNRRTYLGDTKTLKFWNFTVRQLQFTDSTKFLKQVLTSH